MGAFGCYECILYSLILNLKYSFDVTVICKWYTLSRNCTLNLIFSSDMQCGTLMGCGHWAASLMMVEAKQLILQHTIVLSHHIWLEILNLRVFFWPFAVLGIESRPCVCCVSILPLNYIRSPSLTSVFWDCISLCCPGCPQT